MTHLVRSRYVSTSGKTSAIRSMFEEGLRLKREFGEDAVCDFSIGNPDVPAPKAVKEALRLVMEKADRPMAFGYYSYGGNAEIVAKMAAYLTKEQDTPVLPSDVVFCAGASGAICNIFNACLEPGDEILGVAPYFGEYGVWAQTFGCTYKGILVKDDFSFNLPAMEAAFTPKTRVVIYNSPHNPTGHVYSLDDIKGLVEIIRKKSREYGRPILLVADEPYRFLVFGDKPVPSVLPLYEYSCLVGSFAKNMSLPGERIGYLAAAGNMPEKADFIAAITAGNRCMGSGGAPCIGQEIIRHSLGFNTDREVYAKRRDAMADVLTRAGYEFNMPDGAFYFFPKAPGGDDNAFVEELLKHRVLAVQGSSFGMPGYFRLTFCVNEDTIKRSFEGFKKARAAFAGK